MELKVGQIWKAINASQGISTTAYYKITTLVKDNTVVMEKVAGHSFHNNVYHCRNEFLVRNNNPTEKYQLVNMNELCDKYNFMAELAREFKVGS